MSVCQRPKAKYRRISDIFLSRHVGNISGSSLCVSRGEGAQYFILLSMSYRSREVWLLACTNVTTSKRDPDTNLGPNVWTTVLWWPNKRPARVQLAKILVALISVTYPIATGVRCHCPIVASGLNPVHPLVFHATIIFTISSFCRAAPCFSRLHRNSPRFTPLSVSECEFRRIVPEILRNLKSDSWFGEIHAKVVENIAVGAEKTSCAAAAATFLAATLVFPVTFANSSKNLRNDLVCWGLKPQPYVKHCKNCERYSSFFGHVSWMIKTKIWNWNNT